jgi:O-antigen/teichoic acid export membrane protein
MAATSNSIAQFRDAGQARSQSATPALRNSFAWTLLGNLTYALCQWGMITILAKLGSSVVVGRFALGLALCAPVFMFTNLQLRGIQATDAAGRYSFSTYLILRCTSTAVGLAFIYTVTLLDPFDKATKAVVLLVACAKAVETLSDVVSGLLQKVERINQIATALMLRGIVSVIGFGIAYWGTRSLPVAVAALTVAWIAVLASYELRCARSVVRSFRLSEWQPKEMASLAVLSLPLGVVMALISLNANLPRYFLERYCGTSELGIFTSLAYLVTAATLVISALGQSASARLAVMFTERRFGAFKRLIGRLVFTGTALFVAGVPVALIAGRWVLTVLYRREYGDHVNVLVTLLVTSAIAAVGSFLGYGLTAARCLRVQLPITAVASATIVILSLFLIPRHGLQGAALALLGGAFVVALANAVALAAALRGAQRPA